MRHRGVGIFVKNIFCENIKELKSSEIDHGESAVQMLFCDAVGEKGLSNSGIAIEKQILGGVAHTKLVNEMLTFLPCAADQRER